MKHSLVPVVCLILFIVTSSIDVFAAQYSIDVYPENSTGQVNKFVTGNNFTGYEPSVLRPNVWKRGPYYGHTDYGAGVWNPDEGKLVMPVIELAKNAGMSVVRFPGGCGVHHYDWKETIGKGRLHYKFGLDEFMSSVEAIGAEAVITISYFTGSEQDTSDLIEYLNVPADDKNPWAVKRAENGHPSPYGVKFFEFGNEVYHGNHRDIKNVSPEEYGSNYLKYQAAMKKVDPSIKLGLVLHHKQRWNEALFDIVGSAPDFVVRHTSPPNDNGLFNMMSSDELIELSLASPMVSDETYLMSTLEMIKEKTGREDILFAITEHNGGLGRYRDNYRHSLFSALINAELIRIFMKPENKVLMANYWHFANSHFGMIKSETDFMKHNYNRPIKYIKRPIYYVYEFYNDYFGDLLIHSDVNVSSYDVGKYDYYFLRKMEIEELRDGITGRDNLIEGGWRNRYSPRVSVEDKGDILKIEFKRTGEFNYGHSVKSTLVEPGSYYRLSAYVRTENINGKDGVFLSVVDGRGWDKTQSSARTERVSGAREWKYVDIIYKTLPDAASVDVMVRRISGDKGGGGTAFIKDVKFQRYMPGMQTNVPHLSVNASVNKDFNTIYLMVVNRHLKEVITTDINIQCFPFSIKCMKILGGESLRIDSWTLYGPSANATNELIADNVKVRYENIRADRPSFEFSFEPHSLTAIKIQAH